MSTIDERVVAMKFQDGEFQNGVKRTLSSLSALSKGLKLDSASKGLENVGAAANKIGLDGLASSVDGLASKFGTLRVMGVTALATLASRAASAGLALTKSLTISPIKAGFDEYELKMGSIQTILSNTARYGTKLPEVTKNLNELNNYADKTIYNFGDMTKNIGLFTNAGIRVGAATSMIKGFSNEAAASGTSAQGAASAAYQLSQALSAGKVTLMDWRSLQNVGMGNKNMQKGILDIASAMGTLQKHGTSSTKVQKDFNGSLKSGWLTADVMSKYLKIMAGDMTDAQMKSMGLSNAQIKAFKIQQKNAEEAATKVRTFSQLMGTIRESVGSSWTDTFDILIGNFNQATKLFTGINDTLGASITKMGNARNKLLKGWAKLGGRNVLLEGLKNGFEALSIVIKSITGAFRDIFPATTAKQLYQMTVNFRDFMASLKMGGKTAGYLRDVFKGVFSIFSIGWAIIKGVVSVFLNLFKIAQGGGGGFLALAASVGDFLSKINDFLVKSGAIQKFFDGISAAREAVFGPLIKVVSDLAQAFAKLLHGDISGFTSGISKAFSDLPNITAGLGKGFSALVDKVKLFVDTAIGFAKSLGGTALQPFITMAGKISSNLGKIQDLMGNLKFKIDVGGAAAATGAIGTMSAAGEKAKIIWDGVKAAFQKVSNLIAPISSSIGQLFTAITDKITEYIKGLNFSDAVALLNTAFFVMMYKAIKDFMGKLSDVAESFGKIADSIAGTFNQLTDSLKTMQQNVKATIILKIAIAIGILAGSLYLLSTIEPAKLAMSLGAIAALMGMLVLSMRSLLGMMKTVEGETPASMGQIVAAGGALMLLAGAVLLLSIAVKKLSGLSWAEMAKGLIATAVLLGSLALFTKFAEMDKGSLRAGASLVLMAGAIYLLSVSAAKLGQMDVKSLAKGVGALMILLQAMAGFSVIVTNFGGKGSLAIVAMAGALAILTPVIIALGLVPFVVLAKGLGTIGVALALFAGTAVIFSTAGKEGAPGILAMAAALLVLTPAIILLGSIPVATLVQGLIAIAAALAIFVGAAILLSTFGAEGVPGILAMAAALAVLAPVLILLGNTPWQVLALGLGVVAVALGIFVAAGILAEAAAPGLLALSVAVLAVGGAMVLAGLGFAAFGAGFAALAAIGTAGFAVLTAGFMGLLNLIPLLAQQVGLGIIAIAVVIANAGPRIVDAIATVLISFLKAIQRAAPQFFSTMATLIMGLVHTIERLVPQIAAAGARMIINLLTVLGHYVGPMADKATALMIAFIQAIARNVPKLVDAGMKAVIDLVNGIASAIRANSTAMGQAGGNLASAIIQGMITGITGGISSVVSAAKGMAQSALSAAKHALGIHSPSKEFAKVGKYSAQGFADGLTGSKKEVYAAYNTMKGLLSDAMKAAKEDIANAESKLRKLHQARHLDNEEIRQTTKALAQARAEYAKASAAHTTLTRNYKDDEIRLGKLATQADTVSKKLAAAKKTLADAIKTRDDYKKSVTDQFDTLPDIANDTKLTDYMTDLQKKVTDTQLFTAQLQKLRDLGLNDDAYKQLLGKGLDAMPFVQQLLEGGKTSIDQINTLDSALSKAAGGLGSTASKDLYQAAVDSAAGLVKGLEKQQAAIQKQMDKIADAMVNAIKKKLGIHSPSREFMKVGDWSIKGLVKGLQQSSTASNRAAERVGQGTIDSFRKSLTGLTDLIDGNVDVQPVIRPVLDLTSVKKDSDQIGSMLTGRTVAVDTAFAKALDLSAMHTANQQSRSDVSGASTGDNLTFIQNNNSPKALSSADIYRQTKNQINTVKGALTK